MFTCNFDNKVLNIRLIAAKQKAQQRSRERRCTVFVNFSVIAGTFYATDWYDGDSTVARFHDGKETEF
jgi:hypothetical protein